MAEPTTIFHLIRRPSHPPLRKEEKATQRASRVPDDPTTLKALRVRVDRNREAKGIRLRDLQDWASIRFMRTITDIGQMTAEELRVTIRERGL